MRIHFTQSASLPAHLVPLLIIPVILLVTLAVQYPLSVTFPAGGDAAVHVRHARDISSLTANLRVELHSWYPAANVMFAFMRLVPGLDWPMRFVWFMALGQIATGLALGALLWRLRGGMAAGIAMGIWALTPITLTPFFEDATMPQLWSLVWLVLFFERLTARSLWGMAVALSLALLTHPITALVLVATLAVSSPLLLIVRRQVPQVERGVISFCLTITLLALLAAGNILASRSSIFELEFTPEGSLYVSELLTGPSKAWLGAAIFGAIVFITQFRKQPVIAIVLSSFLLISWLLSINDQLGIGLWTKRLVPYLVVAITIFAAMGFEFALRHAILPKVLQPLLFALIFVPLLVQQWNFNANIYHRLESPAIYARLDTNERAAITWANQNLASNAQILTSSDTRHYEWFPALGNLSWEATNKPTTHPRETYIRPTYFAYFTKINDIPAEVTQRNLPIAFQNDSAVIVGPL